MSALTRAVLAGVRESEPVSDQITCTWIWLTYVLTHNRVDLWLNLCTSLLYFVVRVRCSRKERSLSHLLMSFLWLLLSGTFLVTNTILTKKRLRMTKNDLRPISLTATLSKILESFVGGWILEAVGHQLDTNQYVALKQRSTSHALCVTPLVYCTWQWRLSACIVCRLQ